MNAPHTPAPPKLLSIKWISSRVRDGRIVVDAKYAVEGNHVFKRVDGPLGFVYLRAPIKAVIHLTYWSDIADATWEQCDAYGFPLFRDR